MGIPNLFSDFPSVFNAVETLLFPTLAAVRGLCMKAGLEIALAFWGVFEKWWDKNSRKKEKAKMLAGENPMLSFSPDISAFLLIP